MNDEDFLTLIDFLKDIQYDVKEYTHLLDQNILETAPTKDCINKILEAIESAGENTEET